MISGIPPWLVSGAIAALVAGHGHGAHALNCSTVTAALAGRVQDLRCVDSPDLTTQNPDTTPLDNARADLPPLAFTPRTDRASVVSDVQRTPIAHAVPGLQITGAMADDAGARFVIRLPATGFTGRLIVGVPGSTRSEYTGDFFASDLVVQRGDAYVMSNKGAYNLRITPATDPLGCALAPPGVPAAQTFVRAYAGDRPHGIEQWFPRTVQSAELARDAVRAAYGTRPRHTYLFGVSAGGLTVRHILAFTPHGFDGGVDWEGLFVMPRHPTVLREYPGAVAGFLDYRASHYDPASPGASAILGLGFAPDALARPPTPQNTASPVVGSYWETAANSLWNVLGCLFIRALDPTYTGEIARYDVDERRAESVARAWELNLALARIATPGTIERPLITVSGTIDQLAPIDEHARAFHREVVRSGRAALHRLYEVQNGGHLDRLRDPGFQFTELEYVAPHAQRALDLLERWVEHGSPAPAGQCIPRGAAIAGDPRAEHRPEHCAELVVDPATP
jgi:hypothetical protein